MKSFHPVYAYHHHPRRPEVSISTASMRTTIEPIHTGQVNGKPVRFFRPPTDGTPDLPWHDHQELTAALGLSREQRRHVQQQLRSGPFKGDARTIGTAQGITTICPHSTAQGFIGALGGEDSVAAREYEDAGIAALRTLTAGMTFQAAMSYALSAAKGESVSVEFIPVDGASHG